MKHFILFASLCIELTVFAQHKPITAKVVFSNFTELDTITGVLKIKETQAKIPVLNTKPFTITLPKAGSYTITFNSETIHSYIYTPKKITAKQNIIHITLLNYDNTMCDGGTGAFPLTIYTVLSDDAIEKKIANNTMNFIVYGLVDNNNSKLLKAFKNKYGIGVCTKNCVVDPYTFKITSDTNKTLENYLNRKYGNGWKNELNITPFGL